MGSLRRAGNLPDASTVIRYPAAALRGTSLDGASDRAFKPSVFVYGGPALVETTPTALGKAVVLQYKPNPFFIGTGVAFQWDWRSRH